MRSVSAALCLISPVFPICSWSEHCKSPSCGVRQEAGGLVSPVFILIEMQ